jgi:hypothetical protein
MDKQSIKLKEAKLQEVSALLKKDFIGLDAQIDKIIESIRIWFIMPELLSRPPIINLWGMTGTGKTDLVRKLSRYLEFADRLVEIQMDAEVKGAWSSIRSVKDAILCSDIEEGEQGILLFDEFQRFEGKDSSGGRIEHDKFNDIWMLMSDGVFNTGAQGIKSELIEYIYTEEELISASIKRIQKIKDRKDSKSRGKSADDKPKTPRVFASLGLVADDEDDDDEDEEDPQDITPYGDKLAGYYKAKSVKKQLRLPHSIKDIAVLDNHTILQLFKDNLENPDLYTGGNYAKVLIFICGNLDDAYSMADDVAEADLSADILHKYSLKINLVSIKNCLGEIFFPEQVARLGNNHVIYPCLSSDSYRKIIRKTLNEFSVTLKETHEFVAHFTDDLIENLYTNYVYPSQGVRPVFSGINTFLSEVVPPRLFQIINRPALTKELKFGANGKQLWCGFGNGLTEEFFYNFELANIKQKISLNKRIMYSVHEGGHALVYAELFGYAPKIINTEITSFAGAYVLPNEVADTKETMISTIKVYLAGTVAEEIVFGEGKRSSGCSDDIFRATSIATTLVRKLNMGDFVGLVGRLSDMCDTKLSNVSDTNEAIEHILSDCRKSVETMLNDRRGDIKRLTDELIEVKKMNGKEFCDFFADDYPHLKYIDPLDLTNDDEIVSDYSGIYGKFKTGE